MTSKQTNSFDKDSKGNQIIAAGMNRSGSTLMYQVLCALFPNTRIIKTHKLVKQTNAKIVVTYRDFRDVAVSLTRMQRSRKNQPFREQELGVIDSRETLQPLNQNNEEKITRKELESTIQGVLSQIKNLDEYKNLAISSKRVLLMRYELFHQDYEYIFQKLSEFFKIKIDKTTRQTIIKTTGIESNLKRASQLPDFSYYDPQSHIHGDHIYDGKVGGWVRFIDPEDYDLVYELLGDALVRYNYIPTHHSYLKKLKENKRDDPAQLISCKRYKIAHIINPVIVKKSSDLYIAQPITFATMKTAQQQAKGKVDVTIYTAQYPEDHAIVPEGFIKTPDLDRSILDIAQFSVPRKLPLIKDILDRLYQIAIDADYLIYTNVEIAFQPHFYTEVAKIIEQGYDAFVITRRTIPDHYKSISEIPKMYAEKGKNHPGSDCFVFRRSLYKKFYIENNVLGRLYSMKSVLLNCLCHAKKFQFFRDLYLTFHIGDSRTWNDSKLVDYTKHNMDEVQKVFDYYLHRNLLPNHPLVKEKFSEFTEAASLHTPSVELPTANATANVIFRVEAVVSDLIRGNQLLRSGELENAVVAYQNAILKNASFHWSHYQLGEALRKLGNWEEAIKAYQNAIKLNQKSFFAYGKLAEVLAEQGKIEEATNYCQQAIQINPKHQAKHPDLIAALSKLKQ